MKYRDYKTNAKKHLDACLSILNTYSDNVVPESVLRELHYLSGYIIEGICVYAIYKHYEWEEDRDIKEYDEDYFCSECGHHLEPYELLPHLIIPDECPDCGAKIDNEDED